MVKLQFGMLKNGFYREVAVVERSHFREVLLYEENKT